MTPTLFRSRQTGFSLIEIMVGLVIGMVGVIILSQVMLQSEDTKRNTTSGDDAQINASIALSSLERDIRMSGFGLNSYNLLGCAWTFTPSNESSALTNALAIAPVVINPSTSLVPAGDANTDTLLVMYGKGPASAIVCTPLPGISNVTMFWLPPSASESTMAWRSVPVLACGAGFVPPLSPVLVTV